MQASGFFQDFHLVKVLCGVLGERLCSTDAPATNNSTEQPSARKTDPHPVRGSLWLNTSTLWSLKGCLVRVLTYFVAQRVCFEPALHL